MLSKKNIFRIILFLIPFVIFFILELVLRITGYEDELNFVSKVDRNGKEYYTINQLVGKRYFGKDRLYYRKGSHDYFEVNKSSNTIRVFCLGASTMAGFPYEYNAIPTEFLRDRLKTAFPGKNIEVINTAIAATNSFTVDEFADELVSYKPDLFIVYMGQNEFYGVYGVGSTVSVGNSRWLIKTYLWFQHFKTFLLLKNVINSVAGFFGSDNTQDNKILMEEMAKTSIKYNSNDFKTGVNTFRDNYEELIDLARAHNIPILISTLVTNENDVAPFVSFHSDSLSNTLKLENKKLDSLGLIELQKNNYELASEFFKKSILIDSLPADVHYQLGECYEGLKNYHDAIKEYSLARDLDGLRFRAPSDFNKIIRKFGNQLNVPIADVKNEFSQNSKNGLIGSGLLIDHVHPNIKGYFLLAKTWFQTIKENKILGLSPNIGENDSLLWKESAVTQLDSLIGAIKILELKSRPPFSQTEESLNYEPHSTIEQIAFQYVVSKKLSWASAHMNVVKYYLGIGNYSKTLDELRAILVSDQDNPMILKLAGDMALQLNLLNKAEKYYLTANKYSTNQFIEYKLGKTELLLGKPSVAIQFFTSSLERNKQSSDKLSAAEIEDIYYNLAAAYNRVNEPEKAKEIMGKLLNKNMFP